MVTSAPRLRPAGRAAVVALLVAGAAGCSSGLPSDGTTTALPGRSTVAAPQLVDQSVPGPVLLVPGYGGSVRDLDALRDLLESRGRTVVEVQTPDDGVGDLRGQAAALAAAAAAAVAAGAPSVDIIGYSAGGVVARVFVAEQGGAALVRRVVTIGSPHHGTQLALSVDDSACPEACRQLRPDSDLLATLPEPPIAAGHPGPLFTSLWSANDEVIAPPMSSVLEGALSIQLQDVCADDRSTHTMLPRTPLVGGLVLRALGASEFRAVPGPRECATLRTLG